MSDPKTPPPLPAAPVSGPGSPREVPPLPGHLPIDPASLPEAMREQVLAPDPPALDTADPALADGLNRCPKCGATMPAHRAARLSHHCPHNRNREVDWQVVDEGGERE